MAVIVDSFMDNKLFTTHEKYKITKEMVQSHFWLFQLYIVCEKGQQALLFLQLFGIYVYICLVINIYIFHNREARGKHIFQQCLFMLFKFR